MLEALELLIPQESLAYVRVTGALKLYVHARIQGQLSLYADSMPLDIRIPSCSDHDQLRGGTSRLFLKSIALSIARSATITPLGLLPT